MNRQRSLNQINIGNGPVVYWMSRDQRVYDNWALLYAQEKSIEQKSPLVVLFNFTEQFTNANWRHYEFMIKGLFEVQSELKELDIPFIITYGRHEEQVKTIVNHLEAGLLVTDFSPLRSARNVRRNLARDLKIPVDEVDAHNIIPAWLVSDKQEYAARTIRPKIHKSLPQYLSQIPKLKRQALSLKGSLESLSFDQVYKSLELDKSVSPITWLEPGYSEGMKILDRFINQSLNGYSEKRNDTNEDF